MPESSDSKLSRHGISLSASSSPFPPQFLAETGNLERGSEAAGEGGGKGRSEGKEGERWENKIPPKGVTCQGISDNKYEKML